MYVVCPHCHTTNRIPDNKAAERGKCGKCKNSLFIGHPVELTSTNFSIHAERSSIPVVVGFWAPWCGPCHIMAPFFEQAARELEPQVQLARVDTEAEPGIAAQFGIRSIPTLVIFKHGRETARQAGAMDLGTLLRWIRSQL